MKTDDVVNEEMGSGEGVGGVGRREVHTLGEAAAHRRHDGIEVQRTRGGQTTHEIRTNVGPALVGDGKRGKWGRRVSIVRLTALACDARAAEELDVAGQARPEQQGKCQSMCSITTRMATQRRVVYGVQHSLAEQLGDVQATRRLCRGQGRRWGDEIDEAVV